MPWFQSFNPAYADVNAQQVWGKAEANRHAGRQDAGAGGGRKHCAEIKAAFAKYPVPSE